MNFTTILRILRRRWATVFVVASLVLALSAVGTLLTTKTYRSTVAFVVQTTSGANSSDLAQGATFLSRQIKTYTLLTKTDSVLVPTLEKSGVDMSLGEFRRSISVSNPPDSFFLNVSVTSTSAADAEKLASTLKETFPAVVEQTASQDGSTSPVVLKETGPPSTPRSPVSPQPTRNIALGLILGLILGVTAALVRHLLDARIRTKEDVEEVDDHTIIGAIPFDADAQASPLIVQADPQAPRAEAYRSLRTNLQFIDAANHPRVMVVTSSVASEGKTSTVANLALAMASSGQRACVVEADLRRPMLLSYLGMVGTVGLTDVLIGRYPLTDVIQQYGDHSLAVLGAGASPPNPSELLGSPGMLRVLQQLREMFDYVILDGAPLLPVTDSAILARHTDGAIVVVGSNVVTRDQLKTSLESLTHANGQILGLVLNKVPRSTRGAYAYSYEYRPLTDKDGNSLSRSARRRQPEVKSGVN